MGIEPTASYLNNITHIIPASTSTLRFETTKSDSIAWMLELGGNCGQKASLCPVSRLQVKSPTKLSFTIELLKEVQRRELVVMKAARKSASNPAASLVVGAGGGCLASTARGAKAMATSGSDCVGRRCGFPLVPKLGLAGALALWRGGGVVERKESAQCM